MDISEKFINLRFGSDDNTDSNSTNQFIYGKLLGKDMNSLFQTNLHLAFRPN